MIIAISGSKAIASGYADSGVGAHRQKIVWFTWDDPDFADGIHSGDSANFTLPNGEAVTITFSNVIFNPNFPPSGNYLPADFQPPWATAGDERSFHPNYNFVGSSDNGALYSGAPGSEQNGQNISFDVSVSMTIGGLAATPDLVFADGESTNPAATYEEVLTATTNGGNWSLIENLQGTTYTVTGIGTSQTVVFTDTETPQHGPLLVSKNASMMSLDYQYPENGHQAFILGILLPHDHPDAPATYGDAAHLQDFDAAAGPTLTNTSTDYLGAAAPDIEETAAFSAAADGDGADEDGVTFPTLAQGASVTIPVDVVQAAANDGYLQGWIDWNGDGDFNETVDGESEQIATNLQYSSGTTGIISVPVTVPASATNQTYARFRWSTISGLDSTTTASDGEVEDYQLNIQSTTPVLTVLKTTSTPIVTAGQQAQYTITMTNSGLSPADGVVISDSPENAGFSHDSTGTITFTGGASRTSNTGNNPWGTFSIPSGGSVTIPVTYNVGVAVTPGVYDNSASVTTTTNGSTINNYDGTSGSNSDEDIEVTAAVCAPGEILKTYNSTDTPISIGTASVTSTINIADSFTINDVNVANLNGTHTWINDLSFTLTKGATSVPLFSNICNSEDDFFLTLDDEATSNTLPCPPVGGGSFQSVGNLSDFDNENTQGNWVLTINDSFTSADSGQLASWSLDMCVTTPDTFDYGDAPDTTAGIGTGDYQTLSANGGPSHIIDSNLYLGPTVPDADTDGFVDGSDDTTNASDDDAAGAPGNGADEGGITLGLLSTTDSGYTVDIDVVNTNSSTVTLIGWIDFDLSGTFDTDEEAILTGVLTGTQTLNWGTLPLDITAGTTYARFRLSTDALTESDATGAADDGEVEDYQLVISVPVTFACDGTLYMSKGSSNSLTPLNNIDLSTNPFTFNLIGGSTDYNGIGYRTQDNFLYGMEGGQSNRLVRIDNTGTATDLGVVQGLASPSSSLGYIVGDFASDGFLYIKEQGLNRTVYVIDVTTVPATLVRSFDLDQDLQPSDWSFNPIDGRFYSVTRISSDNNQLISFDPNAVAPVPVLSIGPLHNGNFYGATFIDFNGEFYASENAGLGFFHFDLSTGVRTKLGDLSSSAGNDGANCPLVPISLPDTDLVLTKIVSNGTPNESDTITYTVTVNNNGPNGATGIIVTDLLLTGLTYSSDTPSQGTYDDSTGLWEVGGLDASRSATLSLAVTVDSGTGGTTIINTATITSVNQNDTNPGDENDSVDITVVPNFDFGDAPDTYGTDNTAGNSGSGIDPVGANHSIDSNIYIGPTVPDADADGFVEGTDTTGNAGDDDAAAAPGNGTDEGGITLGALTTSNTSYSVDVDVFNNTGSDAYLVGWIDFDGSGVFDADEGVVFDSDGVTAGIQPMTSNASLQNLTLDWTNIGGAGPDIAAGTTYVRFRLSTDADVAGGGTNLTVNTPTGTAGDGEVEDYQLEITAGIDGISGRIFEDINYGGGAGRDYLTADTSAQNSGWAEDAIGSGTGVVVELYEDQSGNFIKIADTTTDADGNYSFPGLSDASYRVRVVNDTVISNRGSNASGNTPLAIQTFRNDPDSGGAVTSEVGGATPTATDSSGTQANGTDLSTLTAQSVTEIIVAGSQVIDVDFGFNFDTIVNTNDSGPGSLRQFILNSNELDSVNLAQEGLTAGVETSVFMIPGTGDALGRTADPNFNGSGNSEFTITPTSVLPTITDTVILDGTTQAEFTATPIIELDGSSIPAGTYPGLHISGSGADSSQISGFVVHSSPDQGIFIDSTRNVTIIGNYIGTDVTGTVDQGNGGSGIQVTAASGVVIGGLTATDLNLISGNGSDGILLSGHTGGTIQGNYVGVDSNGTAALGNDGDGIQIFFGSGNQVGGTAVEARNIVSGNTSEGIYLRSSTDNVIENNYIGTDINGTAPLGNSGFSGVFFQGNSADNRVGGTTTDATNIIAFNTGDGIASSNSITQNNTFIGNTIHTNGDLGIDLASDDVTTNDAGDGDTGSNSKLNFPEFVTVIQNGASLDLNFNLDLPAGDYRIEFFDNPTGIDASLHGEGQTFIGATTISHTGSGVENFSTSFTFTASSVTNVTSTTTEDLGSGNFGSTSEFSTAVTPLDYGDAPDSYGTNSTDDGDEGIGPSHNIDSNLYIGPTVPDADTDGFVDGSDDTTNAGDDDAAAAPGNGDDEGGITLNALATADTSYSVDVDVLNNTGSDAYLVGWIDFDGSGVFDADEGVVFDSDGVTAGIQPIASNASFQNLTLNWTDIGGAGPDIAAGTTYARFRLSTDTDVANGGTTLTVNTPGGAASDGEIEDYQLEITAGIDGISGRIFEDINYSGGAGRDYATVDTSAQASGWAADAIGSGAGVVVELYEDQSGNFIKIAETTTDADGNYSFTALADNTYRVRVVNDTVVSNRPLNAIGNTPLAIQTFRNDPDSGGAVSNEVGGATPTAIDTTGTQANGTDLSTITAQSITEITITGGAGSADVDFGYNFDTIVNTNDSGPGSLRQFILNSNELDSVNLAQEGLTAGEETSVFMIPGTADVLGRPTDPNFNGSGNNEFAISPTSALPTITDTVILDGTNQAEFSTIPIIELDGSGIPAGASPMLHVAGSDADNSRISGFVIHSGPDQGIFIDSSNSVTVISNYIGTDITGTVDQGNTGSGIQVSGGSGIVIGGVNATDLNLISGNGANGILLGGHTGGTIQGNFVGVDINGTTALGNDEDGIQIFFGSGNQVGGTAVEARNIVSGNTSEGIYLRSSTDNVIENNYIGTDINGTAALGNAGFSGVFFQGNSTDNRVGGTTTDALNIIAFNTGDGIASSNTLTQSNTFIGNAIHSNGDLGIDLASDSVTTNDVGDGDTGSNGKLNFPEFVTVLQNGANLDISFNLDVPGGDYRIEFFDNPSGIDASLHGEGQIFVGATTITHTGSGVENFNTSFTFTASDVENITSTTTEDLGGGDFSSTSEFSETITPLDYGDAPDSYGTDSTDDGGEGIGPSHIIESNLYIGLTVPDADSDGFVDGTDDNTNAGDDDAASAPGNGADEGGITFAALATDDTTYSVDINVFNNTGIGAFLVGWIDFDDSGVFDADEGVVYDSDGGTAGIQPIASNASLQNLTLDWNDIGGAGPDITAGTTYARFRLSTDADIAGGGTELTVSTPGGTASDGEVEDYELTITTPAVCAPVGGLVINEASNGSGGGEEWVELLVIGNPASPTAPVDVDGWIIDDNNGEFEGTTGTGLLTGHLFLDDPMWQSIDPGSLIVIYRQSEKDPLIPGDDPTDSDNDGVYILPADHSSLSRCSNVPSSSNPGYTPCTVTAPSWPTQLRNGGDVVQVRPPDGCFFHGYAYGDVDVSAVAPTFPSGSPTWNIGAGGTGSTFIFHCGDWEDQTNFERADLSSGTTRSPGGVNSVDNNTFISKIIDGSLDYSDLNNTANCTITLTSDYGDAPDSYGTDSTNSSGEGVGPSHTIVSGIHMGINAPDADSDGFGDGTDDHGDATDDDDLGGTDDEDGVATFPTLPDTTTSYSVNVTVTNDTGNAATLIGWIDFDRNGTFDIDETATATVAASGAENGIKTLTWSIIPNDITTGISYARFRLTTDTGITIGISGGQALDGEVEDYQLTIATGCAVTLKPPKNENIPAGGRIIYNHALAIPTGSTAFIRIDLVTSSPTLSYTFYANSNTTWFIDGGNGIVEGGGVGDDVFITKDSGANFGAVYAQLAADAVTNFNIEVEAPATVMVGTIDTVDFRAVLDVDGDFSNTADQCTEDVTDVTTVAESDCNITISPPFSGQISSGGSMIYTHTVFNGSDFTGFVRIDLVATNPLLTYSFIAEGPAWQLVGSNGDAEATDTILIDGELEAFDSVFVQLESRASVNFRVHVRAANSVSISTVEQVSMRAVMDLDGDYDGTTDDQCAGSVTNVTSISEGYLKLDKDASASDTHTFSSTDGSCSPGGDGVTGGPCDTITYTLTYKNLGIQDAIDLIVTDQIPEHTTYVGGSVEFDADCNGTGGDPPNAGDSAFFDAATDAVIWTLSQPVAPGEEGCLKYKVTIDGE